MLRPIARLVELSERPAFLVHCPGQKHRGKTFKEVAEIDPSYLTWIVEKSDMSEDAKFTARWHLERSAAGMTPHKQLFHHRPAEEFGATAGALRSPACSIFDLRTSRTSTKDHSTACLSRWSRPMRTRTTGCSSAATS